MPINIKIHQNSWKCNNYSDHVRHFWDIFGTLWSLKSVFLRLVLDDFRLKISKKVCIGQLWLYKDTTFLMSITKSLDAYGQSIWLFKSCKWSGILNMRGKKGMIFSPPRHFLQYKFNRIGVSYGHDFFTDAKSYVKRTSQIPWTLS